MICSFADSSGFHLSRPVSRLVCDTAPQVSDKKSTRTRILQSSLSREHFALWKPRGIAGPCGYWFSSLSFWRWGVPGSSVREKPTILPGEKLSIFISFQPGQPTAAADGNRRSLLAAENGLAPAAATLKSASARSASIHLATAFWLAIRAGVDRHEYLQFVQQRRADHQLHGSDLLPEDTN